MSIKKTKLRWQVLYDALKDKTDEIMGYTKIVSSKDISNTIFEKQGRRFSVSTILQIKKSIPPYKKNAIIYADFLGVGFEDIEYITRGKKLIKEKEPEFVMPECKNNPVYIVPQNHFTR
jgi:hypothetical protein